MYYTVYKITNLLNGKIYVGCHKTRNLDDEYMGSGVYLKRAQEKHGIENFVKEFVAVFDNPDSMFEMESKIVNEEFVSREDVYNIKEGGFGGWPPGAAEAYKKLRKENPTRDEIDSERAREQCRKNIKTIQEKRKIDPAFDSFFREQCRVAFKGKQHTKEAKRAIGRANSIHQQGKKNSQYGTMWIHSLELKQSTRIKKDSPIPEGWNIGRKIKFDQ